MVLIAGGAWRVTAVDWRHRRCFVEPSDLPGNVRGWRGTPTVLHAELCRAMCDVVLGADPAVTLTSRAAGALGRMRERLMDRRAATAVLARPRRTVRR